MDRDLTAPPVAADASIPIAAGLAYADARQALLAAGWAPHPDPRARAQVIGDHHATLCAAHPHLATCRACDALPELAACSGDGRCLLRFSHTGRVLEVVVHGELADFDVHGADSGLAVQAWEEVAPR